MKKILMLFTIVAVMAVVGLGAKADGYYTSSCEVMFVSQPTTQDENQDDDTKRGRRIPPIPLHGRIDRVAGVHIPTLDKSDILSYEIHTDSGVIVGMYEDEADFIDTFFTLSGSMEVRISTENRVYLGHITL